MPTNACRQLSSPLESADGGRLLLHPTFGTDPTGKAGPASACGLSGHTGRALDVGPGDACSASAGNRLVKQLIGVRGGVGRSTKISQGVQAAILLRGRF